MNLNKIWIAFIVVSILAATVKLIFNSEDNANIYSQMVTGDAGDTISVHTYDSAHVPQAILTKLGGEKQYIHGQDYILKRPDGSYAAYKIQASDGIIGAVGDAVGICLGLIGIIALFMSFLSIAENAGGIRLLSRIIGPFFTRLFPEIPKGHPSLGHMMLNFSANLMGLDNAATPFGIKAMQSLQELNPDKTKATNAQIMFLCLHAAGLTLIPVSIIALRGRLGADNPTDIFLPCLIATFVATMAAMIIVSIRQKINLFQPVILAWILGISTVIAGIVWGISQMNRMQVGQFSLTLSNGLILLLFLVIVLGAVYKKINVFSAFVEAAQGGFNTAVQIMPYLIGMLLAISLLRNSGVFDIIVDGLKWVFTALHLNTDIVDALPTALIKPISGNGARGMMIDTMKMYGPESFAGRLSCVFQGSSDTTLYVVAVYFGAVSIKNTRYAVGAMLLADLVGIIVSIIICSYWPW